MLTKIAAAGLIGAAIGGLLLGVAAGCGSSSNAATSSAEGGANGDGGLLHIDRSNLADTGTTGSLDYSNPSLWVCRPGIDKNPCYDNLDATELEPDGGTALLPHTRDPNPKFDCFYVYPTVDLTTNGNMTDFSSIDLVLDPLYAQAARFSEMCEIYAPLYRQVAFTAGTVMSAAPTDGGADGGASGIGALTSSPAAALALHDVHDAFHYYLDHFNHGRKFVIMGHSQGSAMLAALMQTDVDPVAPVRSQMISALLIGGGTTVAPAQTTGGTFKNIPICNSPGSTGCMVAYSSFDIASPPGSNALFGKSPDGNQVACTNPSSLAGASGPYAGSYFPRHLNNGLLQPDNAPPDASTPFVLYRDTFQGNCVVKNGFSYLEVTYLGDGGGPWGTPPYKNTVVEGMGFGLHLVDYNIPMQELLDTVKAQAAAAGL
jgi:hypothetical protein